MSLPIIGKYPGATCFNRKIFCKVSYEDDDPLYFGLILKTLNTNNTQYYSIATGKVGENSDIKDGKKYYEIYPELYTLNQAKIINSALTSIKWADEEQKYYN